MATATDYSEHVSEGVMHVWTLAPGLYTSQKPDALVRGPSEGANPRATIPQRAKGAEGPRGSYDVTFAATSNRTDFAR